MAETKTRVLINGATNGAMHLEHMRIQRVPDHKRKEETRLRRMSLCRF